MGNVAALCQAIEFSNSARASCTQNTTIREMVPSFLVCNNQMVMNIYIWQCIFHPLMFTCGIMKLVWNHNPALWCQSIPFCALWASWLGMDKCGIMLFVLSKVGGQNGDGEADFKGSNLKLPAVLLGWGGDSISFLTVLQMKRLAWIKAFMTNWV